VSQKTENPWNDLTRTWGELYQQQAELGKSWVEAQAEMLQGVAASSGGEGPDVAAVASMWTKTAGVSGGLFDAMADPFMRGTQVTDALRRVTQAPQLADAGGFERKMANLMRLFVDVQTASRVYEAELAQGWAEANQKFASAMSKEQAAETATPKAALKTWLACADEVFRARQRSATFLDAQRTVMRAGIDYLLAERDLFEQFLEPAGLPTRSEIDELHKTVQQLKRQIRDLRTSTERAPSATHPAAPTADKTEAGPVREKRP
jgi:hypothetical protein